MGGAGDKKHKILLVNFSKYRYISVRRESFVML